MRCWWHLWWACYVGTEARNQEGAALRKLWFSNGHDGTCLQLQHFGGSVLKVSLDYMSPSIKSKEESCNVLLKILNIDIFVLLTSLRITLSYYNLILEYIY